MRQQPPTEFFDRHTRSFVLLCCLAATIAYLVCSWLGWDQPGRALVVLLLAELLFVSLGVLAMLLAENWFEELDATPGEWAPIARRGNPKTAFLARPPRGPKFDRTGDYLRMVAGEMQPGTDGSYFGTADMTRPAPGKSVLKATMTTPRASASASPVPRSLSEALQIHRPTARSPLASFVPPPLPPAPVQAPPSPPWPLFVAPAPAPAPAPSASAPTAPPAATFPAAAASPPVSSMASPAPTLGSAVAAAPPFRPVAQPQAPSPPPLPPAARSGSNAGPGPIVTLGTPPGQGAMRPKPPRQRPS